MGKKAIHHGMPALAMRRAVKRVNCMVQRIQIATVSKIDTN